VGLRNDLDISVIAAPQHHRDRVTNRSCAVHVGFSIEAV
jgi:hypothetical protein